MTPRQSNTYVLVHGAWHGGWCWTRVAERLRQAGHTVRAPTLPGLAERQRELSAAITLDDFIQSIADALQQQDLQDVILVGHSFGGLVISGVADRLRTRIRQLVLLDAFLLRNGQSTLDTLPPALVAKLEHKAADTGGIPPLPADGFGLNDPADIAFVQAQLTPQPIGTYRSTFTLRHPLGNGLPVSYIRCTSPAFAGVADCQQWAHAQYAQKWQWIDLVAGHDAMISAPDALTQLLLTIPDQARP
ncbi:alpha/beta fold hydrolase [Castellaniella caeni]|uniref:alpha/beta fold hydrolase n=1 Tax=Castellaniella caeni TaxID=266123 RepID=UPI00082A19A9|nr:alpha/beta fold hydrolase [Castellaniella caeni]